MMNPSEFYGKSAVVTGGGEGLGKDFCRALIEAGCSVFFCDREIERGLAVQEELGPLSSFIAADLADPDQIRAFEYKVRTQTSSIDYLINNVAIDDRADFDDLTPETCDRMWQNNTRSYLLTTGAFLGLLRIGRGKSVLNIGTTNYILGLERFALYNATKSAVVGFTRSLAREIGREGIRVNLLSPGWIMTKKQLEKYVTPRDKEDLLRDQALKYLLTPEDVTPAAMFLLSSAASGITGQNLVVDGGKVMY